MTMYNTVRRSLKDMCNETSSAYHPMFRVHFTARQVAERAGCSEATARKHLNALASCYGYAKKTVGGTTGYRAANIY